MMLAAVEAVAQADPVGLAFGDEADGAAKATAGGVAIARHGRFSARRRPGAGPPLLWDPTLRRAGLGVNRKGFKMPGTIEQVRLNARGVHLAADVDSQPKQVVTKSTCVQ